MLVSLELLFIYGIQRLKAEENRLTIICWLNCPSGPQKLYNFQLYNFQLYKLYKLDELPNLFTTKIYW